MGSNSSRSALRRAHIRPANPRRRYGPRTYPDVSVVCGQAETEPDEEHVLFNAILLVEVTTPSNAVGEPAAVPSRRNVSRYPVVT